MSNWETKKLKDLATFSQGIQIDLDEHKKFNQEKYVPFLRIENYTQKSNDLRYVPEKYAKGKMVSKNDIVVVRYGASSGFIGRGHEGILANNLFKVEPNQLITKDYLYLILKSSKTKRFIQRAMFGGAMPAISFGLIGAVEVKYPNSIALQDDIVAKFDVWDIAIEKTEALIDAKERQFGWLKSKLLLRNPNAKHWKTETLGHYIEEKKDKSTVPDLHPCLTSSRRGMFLQDEYFSKQVASKDNTGYKIMSRGDFTYRSMSDDGTFVFNKQDIVDKGLISPAYGVFAPNKHMDADFLYYFLNSSAFKRALAGEVQGGTRTALKLNALKKLDVDIPELPEQKAIANKLNTAKHEIDLLIKLADQYRTQKRGLMQKLLSGEWHIKNKEAA